MVQAILNRADGLSCSRILNKSSQAPLHCACAQGCFKIASLLMKADPSMNDRPDKFQKTPATWARQFNYKVGSGPKMFFEEVIICLSFQHLSCSGAAAIDMREQVWDNTAKHVSSMMRLSGVISLYHVRHHALQHQPALQLEVKQGFTAYCESCCHLDLGCRRVPLNFLQTSS